MERPTKRRKTTKQPKEKSPTVEWPEYFNEASISVALSLTAFSTELFTHKQLFKVFKAINTVLGFVSTRKQLAMTFDVVRSSVENLTKKPLNLEQVAELKALLPDVVKFAYIPQNQLQVHSGASTTKKRSKSPDFGLTPTSVTASAQVVDSNEHVLTLDFVDGTKGTKTQNMGLLPAASLTPQAVKKLIEKRNEVFQRAVDELIKSTLSPNAVSSDSVQLLKTASLAHVPVNPNQAQPTPVKTEVVPNTIDPETDRSERIISTLHGLPWYRDQIVDKRTFSLKEEQTALLDPPLSKTIAAALWDSRKITKLYTHQVAAIQAITRQKHVIVSTSTASGKSIIYQVPILRYLEEDSESTAFFIYPTKALAQDQKGALEQLIGSCVSVQHHRTATYDGDTPTEERAALREQCSVIFTNFDMLHVGILPHEELWRRFFKSLKLVVIDELHYYSGLFGSHVAQIMRRLRRICAAVGNLSVRIISCSATISNPRQHMSKITGVAEEEIEAVTADGAPAGRKDFIVWNPSYIDPMAPELGRHSSLNDAVALMKFLMRNDMKVILFCKIRKVCELMKAMKTLRAELSSDGLYDILEKTMPYRGGYSPEDRRRIEADAFNGRLLGIVSTNALELGVDIGILDAVIMLGFPMTLASFRQQAGRAGRRAQDSIAILVADSFPVDQYFAKNPNELFDAPYDDLVIDLENKHLLEGHLQCAAHEMPVSLSDETYFGSLTKEICQTSLIRDSEGWYHANSKFLPAPAHLISIRGVMEEKYAVVNVTRSGHVGTILEEVEISRAMFEVYEGGVFMHQGIPFVVKELSHETKFAKVVQADFTNQRKLKDFTLIEISRLCPLFLRVFAGDRTTSVSNIDAIQTYRIKEIKKSPSRAYFGRIDITVKVFGFFKIRHKTILDSVDLDSPPWEQTTTGFWLDVSEPLLSLFRQKRINAAEAVHAAQHAVMNRFSLAQDLRTECKVAEKEYRSTESARKRPARLIFYDSVGKGGGVASKAFENINILLTKACSKVEACECEAGCKDCVQSPTCKEANLVSSKLGALLILKNLLSQEIDPSAIPVQEDKINYPETIVPATEIKAKSNIRVESA